MAGSSDASFDHAFDSFISLGRCTCPQAPCWKKSEMLHFAEELTMFRPNYKCLTRILSDDLPRDWLKLTHHDGGHLGYESNPPLNLLYSTKPTQQ